MVNMKQITNLADVRDGDIVTVTPCVGWTDAWSSGEFTGPVMTEGYGGLSFLGLTLRDGNGKPGATIEFVKAERPQELPTATGAVILNVIMKSGTEYRGAVRGGGLWFTLDESRAVDADGIVSWTPAKIVEDED